jgi:hypothetical protein
MGCTGYSLYGGGESILVAVNGTNLAIRALTTPFRRATFRHN